jgi:hypothetical protein
MAKVIYRIVEHDGGWAYTSDGVFSETFRTHDQAKHAAQRVAAEQHVAGDDAAISFETADGVWHEQQVKGGDRPDAEVQD